MPARSPRRSPPARKPKPKAKPRRAVKPTPAHVRAVFDGLAKLYPAPTCELDYRTPFELLCATILSAQCTDARVNLTTPELFRRWPDARALAHADVRDVEEVVRSTGFFRNKAKNLVGMARALVEHHGGEVPRTMEEMLELPGVARKTGNVVLGNAYGIASGIAVDTHVMRLTQLLGLTAHDEPIKIEQDLMQLLPREEWIASSHLLILHGRRVCDARKPACDRCTLAPVCPSADLRAGYGDAPPSRSSSSGSSRKKTSS